MRERLGEEAFAAAWEEGQTTTLDQALGLATGSLPHERRDIGPGSQSSAGKNNTGDLTYREREVASLVALGMTNREIAGKLVLSVRTVEMHVAHALLKLGLHTRTELAAWALRPGSQTERTQN